MKRCDRCGAPVVWARTPGGASIALEPDATLGGPYRLTPAGKGERSREPLAVPIGRAGQRPPADARGYLPHRAACANPRPRTSPAAELARRPGIVAVRHAELGPGWYLDARHGRAVAAVLRWARAAAMGEAPAERAPAVRDAAGLVLEALGEPLELAASSAVAKAEPAAVSS